MQEKKYRRLNALAIEVQKIDERLALYKSAADQNAPDVQLMLRQYLQLRRERYADYLQELLALDTHPKAISQYVIQLVEHIYVDDETNTDTKLLEEAVVPVLKAV